ATDAASNRSAATSVPTIIQDSVAPSAPAVTSPPSPARVNTTTYTITGAAEANSLVQVWTDANNNGLVDTGETVVSSQQLSGGATSSSISVSLTPTLHDPLPITATDAASNRSAATTVPTIMQDSVAPSAPAVT